MSLQRMPLAHFAPELVPPGARGRFWLDLFPTPAGVLSLPVLVVRGARPGPTLTAVAGVHGDEFEGMAAIHRVFRTLDAGALAGQFVGMPMANPFAVAGLSRTTPGHIDGANLARIFPGDDGTREPGATPSQRLAAAVLDLVARVTGPDGLLVDFHSSGTRYTYLPMVGWIGGESPVRERSEAAARRFGIDLVWELGLQPLGRLNSQTSLRGIPTIGTETYGMGACRPEDEERFAAGVLSLLRWLGCLPGEPLPRVGTAPARFLHLYCPASGLFRPEPGVELGARFAAGDLLARIVDPLGEEVGQVVAPWPGGVGGMRTFGAVWAGDIAFFASPEV